MTPFKALYERRCITPICMEEVGERRLLGPELVQVTTEKNRVICERLLTTESKQKSYVDQRRRELEFHIGEHEFL